MMDGALAAITVSLTVINMINAAKCITLHCIQVLYISFNKIVFLVIHKISKKSPHLTRCRMMELHDKKRKLEKLVKIFRTKWLNYKLR